jgi:hypothetical protein
MVETRYRCFVTGAWRQRRSLTEQRVRLGKSPLVGDLQREVHERGDGIGVVAPQRLLL